MQTHNNVCAGLNLKLCLFGMPGSTALCTRNVAIVAPSKLVFNSILNKIVWQTLARRQWLSIAFTKSIRKSCICKLQDKEMNSKIKTWKTMFKLRWANLKYVMLYILHLTELTCTGVCNALSRTLQLNILDKSTSKHICTRQSRGRKDVVLKHLHKEG